MDCHMDLCPYNDDLISHDDYGSYYTTVKQVHYELMGC